MNQAINPIIVCADRLRGQMIHGWRGRLFGVLGINLVCWAIGFVTGHNWIQGFGIVMMILIVAKVVRNHNRLLTEIPCPVCGRQVGGYFTKNSRIYLNCRHCHEASATDCGVGAMGGIPYKITW